MTKPKLKTAPQTTAKPKTRGASRNQSKAATATKPFYTWRAEYWTDGPARIGGDYFRTLADMFKVLDPKDFIDKKMDLVNMPCKRVEVTVIENTGKRINGQICSAFNVTVASVGVSANNQINLFAFYRDERVVRTLQTFQKELEKHRANFKRLFRCNQLITGT